ncbi:MAG: LysR family transcriptional regulator [Pseudomonadota bacterium]|nr:LysR family transcriptional regulator [Pseudomonadota bacterium]
MTIDQLLYLSVTAQTQHIGKASKILNVSPSAISHSIRNLELDLGIKLFEKSGKNIYLTESGKLFSLQARKLLDQAESLRSNFRSQHLPLEGVFRIGVTHTLSHLYVTPALGRIQRKHPKLVLEAYSLRSSQVLEMVSLGRLDLGICFSPNPHPTIQNIHKWKIQLKIAVKKKHPLIGKSRDHIISQLSIYPHASPKAFSGIEICENHPALLKFGIKPKVSLMFDSYDVAISYVKNTDGWCLLPEFLIESAGLETFPNLDLYAQSSIDILTPRGRSLPAPILDELLLLF